MKISAILLFLFLFYGPVAADEIKVGVFVHHPVVFQNSITHEAYGPGIDYIRAVIREMGHSADIMLLPIPRIFSYLETGAIDIGLEFAKTADRETFVYYSQLPVFVCRPALIVPAEDKLYEIDTIDDLKGMTIGYILGAFPGYFFADSTAVKFELVGGDDPLEQNLTKLLIGRIDAVLDQNSYASIATSIKLGIRQKIKVLPLPVDPVKGYVVFSKKPKKSSIWLQEFNRVNRSGKYNENKMIEDYLDKLDREVPESEL